jgi:hypothetical protein
LVDATGNFTVLEKDGMFYMVWSSPGKIIGLDDGLSIDFTSNGKILEFNGGDLFMVDRGSDVQVLEFRDKKVSELHLFKREQGANHYGMKRMGDVVIASQTFRKGDAIVTRLARFGEQVTTSVEQVDYPSKHGGDLEKVFRAYAGICRLFLFQEAE